MVKLDSSQDNDLIYESIIDFSKNRAKSYKSGSVFGVDVHVEDEKVIIISISKMEMKYIFKDEQHLQEKPFGGIFYEINEQLYFVSTDLNNITSVDYNLAIKYKMIVFDEEMYVNSFLNDFNDDLKKITYYIYCLDDHRNNIKVFTNNWRDYNRMINQLKCDKNKF